MQFKLTTWNINSVRPRLHLVKQFVDKYKPDILCLQEIKCAEEDFPFDALRQIGFHDIHLCAQKGYHGVATLSTKRSSLEQTESRDFNDTGHARHIAVRLSNSDPDQPTILHNFYVPAGGDEPDVEKNQKFREKLTYLQAMESWTKRMRAKQQRRMILVGDLNVAPHENDVWSHKQLLKVVSHTPIEVEHLDRVQKAHHWIDVVREEIPLTTKLFSWWSYRARDWRASNRGRRLDHIWATPALKGTTKGACVIDEARDWEKPSDHAPVFVRFTI